MWHDFFTNLWLKLFGTLEWGGVNIGFWFSMIICVILVVAMNLVFWLMKPKNTKEITDESKKKDKKKNSKLHL